ncbi:MAG: NAD(P)/FAD-dependent oxidoreductase, partial [Gammaproteobacteria bacterium]|nr:NAD(P)/FAD-dependent oxidoreductase [Gammaproteobacteria bacterium]
KNIQLQRYFYNRTRTHPAKVKAMLLKLVRTALGPHYDVDKHFTPKYNPWDQRLCLIPNDDLFDSIKSGKTKMVTDEIEYFTETGLQLKSGEHIEADILVTATGLNLLLLGGTEFSVDGVAVDFPNTFSYKGMMYSDIPNLIQTFGYINASWTLRADLTAEYATRVINHMDEVGVKQVTPCIRAEHTDMDVHPWIDGFSAGYMQRVMHLFPKQGGIDPWRNTQNYSLDKKLIRKAPLEDGTLVFGKLSTSSRTAQENTSVDAQQSTRTAA